MIAWTASRALIAAAALFPQASSDSRIAVAEIEITGPFEGATLEVATRGSTRIDGRLLASETRILRVPVPSWPSSIPNERAIRLEPSIHLDLGADGIESVRGRLRFLGWRGASAPVALPVPVGLRARPRPPLSIEEMQASPALLAVLTASFLLGLALRRRAIAALGLGVSAATLVFFLGPRRPEEALRRVTLEEGDSQSSVGLEVEAARGTLRIQGEPDALHLETLPADARLACRVQMENAGAWEIAADGAILYRLTRFERGQRSFARAENRWADLEQTWVRAEGSWGARGEWLLGRPLPPETHADPAPGWLAAGLPQGTDILLGRMRARPGEGPVYIRWTGL